MKNKSVDRMRAERVREVARAVRAWQKNSAEKRCSVKKLADSLGVCPTTIRRMQAKPMKRLRKAVEKVKVLNALDRRVKKPKHRRETATKLANDLVLSDTSVRTVRRLRAPYRAAAKAAYKARRLETLSRAASSKGSSQASIDYQASQQGWGE